MKCARHPGREAVGTCTACGKPMCRVCSTFFMGTLHCRWCTKSIRKRAKLARKQMVMSARRRPPVIIPRKNQREDFFLLGGIGAVLMAAAGGIMGYYMLYHVHGQLYAQALEWFVIASIILSMGLVLAGIGCYGFYYNLRTSVGLVASVFLLVSAVFFPVSVLFAVVDLEHGYYIGPEYAGGVFSIGISLILLGATFSKVRYHITAGKMAEQAAFFNVVVGSIFCTVFLAIFFGLAFFVLIISSLISAVTFFRTHTSSEKTIASPLGQMNEHRPEDIKKESE